MKSGLQTRLQLRVWQRAVLLVTGLAALGLIYIFQKINVAGLFGDFSPSSIFILNRTIRLILNDLACFVIILAVFQESKYLRVAFWVFLVELLVILPVYLGIKLTLEGDSEISSPMLSQIHRLIVNPMLMVLLICGFFYQRYLRK